MTQWAPHNSFCGEYKCLPNFMAISRLVVKLFTENQSYSSSKHHVWQSIQSYTAIAAPRGTQLAWLKKKVAAVTRPFC